MKKHTIIMIIFTFAVLATANALGSEMMEPVSKEKLIGSTVQNMEGKNLGKISDVSLDNEGNIRFAILSQGGIPGTREKLIPIPVNAISFKEGKLATVNVSEERLKTAPSISKDKGIDMSDRTWIEETSRFYGVRPYWDESGIEQKMEEMEEPTHDIEEMENEPE